MPLQTRFLVFVGDERGSKDIRFVFDVTLGGVPLDAYDFTSRARQIDVGIEIGFGRPGTSSATIVLSNQDGALTPGGGGTYQSVDWLSQPVWIVPQTSKSSFFPSTWLFPYGNETGGGRNYQNNFADFLFTGIVSDVQFYDDGFDSTITLECADWSTVVDRYVLREDRDQIGLNYTITDSVTELFTASTTGTIPIKNSLPTHGTTELVLTGSTFTPTVYSNIDPSTSSHTLEELDPDFVEGDYFGDGLNDMMAAEYGIWFPPMLNIYRVSPINATGVRRLWPLIARSELGPGINKQTGDMTPVNLKPAGATFGDDDVPFKDLRIGFDIEHHINSANVSNGVDEVTVENSSKVTTYGARSSSLAVPLSSSDASSLDRVQRLADFMVNRFEDVNYVPLEVTITGKMAVTYCPLTADQTIGKLLCAPSITSVYLSTDVGALYRPMTVTYAPAGLPERTENVAFFRASYSITPDDWELRLSDGVALSTVSGFVIGSSVSAILGTSRL